MIVVGTILTLGLFLFVGWIITTEMFQQIAWRRRVSSGNGEIVVALCEEAMQGWRTARPPKGVPANLWASIQGAQLVAASPEHAVVSTAAQGSFRNEGGQRIQETTDIQAAMAVAARLLDMMMYDVPNLRLSSVRVDVYATFTTEQGPAQRPILTTTASRAVADSLQWELLSPDELLEQFETEIGEAHGAVTEPIELPEITGLRPEDIDVNAEAVSFRGGG